MSGKNLELWDRLKRPPKEALKPIMGGRLKGKSDINPMWRVKAMTEEFGACGDKWGYEIKRLWTEPASDGQVFAFAEVELYVVNGEFRDAIPAVGGSMLIEKDRNGLYSNDEAFKMAVTDALGTAMKMLGVAADVYMGLWDGTKYKDAPKMQKEVQKEIKSFDEIRTPLLEALVLKCPRGFIVDMAKVEEILQPVFKGDAAVPPINKLVDGLIKKYLDDILVEDEIPFGG